MARTGRSFPKQPQYIRAGKPTGAGTRTGAFALDAVLQRGMAGTPFNLDAVLLKSSGTKTLTLDAIVNRTQSPTGFSVQAILTRTQSPTGFSLDAVILAAVPGAFTLDAVINRSSGTKTFTADALVLAHSGTKTLTADAVLRKGMTGSPFALDAVIRKAQTGTPLNLDALVLRPSGTKTFTADAVLGKTQTGTPFNLDAVTLKSSGTKTFTADAELARVVTGNFSLDAVLLKTITPTGSQTLWLDNFNGTGTLSAHAPDVGSGYTSLGTDDSSLSGGVMHWQSNTLAWSLDGLGSPGVPVEILWDVNEVEDSPDYSSILFVAHANDGQPPTGRNIYLSYQPDFSQSIVTVGWVDYEAGDGWNEAVYLPDTGLAHIRAQFDPNGSTSMTLRLKAWREPDTEPADWQKSIDVDDSYWASPQTEWQIGSDHLDYYFLQISTFGLSSGLIADAVLLRPSGTKTLTADAVLLASSGTKTFTADAEVVGGPTTVPGEFSADAVLLRSSGTKTFTVDAILLKPSGTKTFSADAVLLRSSGTKTFTVDALIVQLVWKDTFDNRVTTYPDLGSPSDVGYPYTTVKGGGYVWKSGAAWLDSYSQFEGGGGITAGLIQFDYIPTVGTTDYIQIFVGGSSLRISYTAAMSVSAYGSAEEATTGFFPDQGEFWRIKGWFGPVSGGERTTRVKAWKVGTAEPDWQNSRTGSTSAPATPRYGIQTENGLTGVTRYLESVYVWAAEYPIWRLGSFTTAALVLAPSGTKTFTADAVLLASSGTKTFTLDSLVAGTGVGAFIVDAVVLREQTDHLHLDAEIVGTRVDDFTLDAVLLASSGTKAFSADAIVLASSGTKTFTLDAVLARVMPGVLTLDAIILREQAGTPFSLDALVLRPSGTKTFTLDAVVNKPSGTKAFTADAVLKRTQAGTGLTLDSVLLAHSGTKTLTLDAVLLKAATDDFTVDAWLERTVETGFLADAALLREMPGSILVDAWVSGTGVGAFAADAVILREQADHLHLDALVTSTETGDFALEAVIDRAATDSFAVSAVIAWTQGSSLTLDAVLRREMLGQLTFDAVLLRGRSEAFTADAVLLRGSAGATVLDAILSRTQPGSLTADALLLAHGGSSFSLEAVIAKPTSASFSLDAVLGKTALDDLTLDAVLLGSASGAVSLDARLVSVGRAMWTTPANLVQIPDTPTLAFLVPPGRGHFHFRIEIDSADTFDTGDLRVHVSHLDQTGWEYFDGAVWQPVPQAGVADTYVGNEARYTLQTPLANGTWYRRVRAGVF